MKAYHLLLVVLAAFAADAQLKPQPLVSSQTVAAIDAATRLHMFKASPAFKKRMFEILWTNANDVATKIGLPGAPWSTNRLQFASLPCPFNALAMYPGGIPAIVRHLQVSAAGRLDFPHWSFYFGDGRLRGVENRLVDIEQFSRYPKWQKEKSQIDGRQALELASRWMKIAGVDVSKLRGEGWPKVRHRWHWSDPHGFEPGGHKAYLPIYQVLWRPLCYVMIFGPTKELMVMVMRPKVPGAFIHPPILITNWRELNKSAAKAPSPSPLRSRNSKPSRALPKGESAR